MESLIFITVLFILGFLAMPAFVWFVFIGTYSFVFFDLGFFYWLLFLLANHQQQEPSALALNKFEY